MRPSFRPRSGERGYTLIELSIAMVIALFLLGGLLSIVQGQRRTSTNQALLAQLQDNERLAMSMMSEVIQSAGYYPDPTAETLTVALPIDGTRFPTAGQSISGAPGAVATDSLVVRYRTAPNDDVLNCIGGSNTTILPKIYVNTFDLDTTGHLTCSPETGVAAVQLVGGVTNLQVLYGVNTSASTANSNCPADAYLNTAAMNAKALYWTNVCSIKVTITFTNPLRQPVPGIPADPTQPAVITFSRVVGIMMKAGVNVVNLT